MKDILFSVLEFLSLLIIYTVYKIGFKNAILALTKIKNYFLFLAYFLKLAGLGVAGFFLLGLSFMRDETTGEYNWDKNLWIFVVIIGVSTLMSLIGSIWSKKLLKRQLSTK